LRRVFNRLYNRFDLFLYLVDEERLDLDSVKKELPDPLPPNVLALHTPHAGYYYWPRVQVLLNGLKALLSYQWDFAVHLSESDYPLHSVDWIRQTLALQRRHVFLKLNPRCKVEGRKLVRSDWYWWTENEVVASCEAAFQPHSIQGVEYPLQELEQQGFVFAMAPEWLIVPRELVEYTALPELQPFKQLVGMHIAADEIFWATLVLNIPGFSLTINPQSWFMFRSPTNFGHSPDTLRHIHLQKIIADRRMNFFLRKVDEGHSAALLNYLDQVITQPDDPPGPGMASWASDQRAVTCAWTGFEPISPDAYWTPPPEPQQVAPFPAPAPPPESLLP